MAKADVLFDKTEFIVQIADKQAMSMSVKAEDITSITFEPCEYKKLFGLSKGVTEHIVIKTKRMPIMIDKIAVEKKKAGNWDNIKSQMETFAKNNKLSVYHETEVWKLPSLGSDGME